MIFSWPNSSRGLVVLAVVGALASCASPQPPVPAPRATPEIRVISATSGAPPETGAVSRTTVYETPRMVTQVLRIGAGARIAEHHHPHHDETFMVQYGRLTLALNGKTYEIAAGELVVMPAGTVIAGMNPGSEEARVVIAFSNTGTPGPLTVAGSPHH